MSGLYVAILAAGRATRFGSNKLDTPIAKRRLGQFALDNALALEAARTTIIVPNPAPVFARDAGEAGLVDLIVNFGADAGLGGSIALAAQCADAARSDALLLMLADMPLVTPETLRRLAASVSPGRPAAVRYADGGAGIPACFPKDFFAELHALQGDRGAAKLLRESANVQLVEVAAEELDDVDTPADFAFVAQALAASLRRH